MTTAVDSSRSPRPRAGLAEQQRQAEAQRAAQATLARAQAQAGEAEAAPGTGTEARQKVDGDVQRAARQRSTGEAQQDAQRWQERMEDGPASVGGATRAGGGQAFEDLVAQFEKDKQKDDERKRNAPPAGGGGGGGGGGAGGASGAQGSGGGAAGAQGSQGPSSSGSASPAGREPASTQTQPASPSSSSTSPSTTPSTTPSAAAAPARAPDAPEDPTPAAATGDAPAPTRSAAEAVRERKAVDGLRQDLAARTQKLAESGQLGEVMAQSFGDKAKTPKAQELEEQAKREGIPQPKNVSFKSDADMNGKDGAYSPEDGGTVFLNEKLKDDPAALSRTWAEEAGHHLDHVLGGKDSAGDEGELFARGVEAGGRIGEGEASAIRAEDDRGTVHAFGKDVPVENKDAASSQERLDQWAKWLSQPHKPDYLDSKKEEQYKKDVARGLKELADNPDKLGPEHFKAAASHLGSYSGGDDAKRALIEGIKQDRPGAQEALLSTLKARGEDKVGAWSRDAAAVSVANQAGEHLNKENVAELRQMVKDGDISGYGLRDTIDTFGKAAQAGTEGAKEAFQEAMAKDKGLWASDEAKKLAPQLEARELADAGKYDELAQKAAKASYKLDTDPAAKALLDKAGAGDDKAKDAITGLLDDKATRDAGLALLGKLPADQLRKGDIEKLGALARDPEPYNTTRSAATDVLAQAAGKGTPEGNEAVKGELEQIANAKGNRGEYQLAEKAKAALQKAEFEAASPDGKAILAAKEGLTEQNAKDLVERFPGMSAEDKEKAFQAVKENLNHPGHKSYIGVNELAWKTMQDLGPNLSADQVKQLAEEPAPDSSFGPRLPAAGIRDMKPERQQYRDTQSAWNRRLAHNDQKTDTLASIAGSAKDPAAQKAATDALLDQPHDRLSEQAKNTLVNQANASGDVEQKLKVKQRFPDADVHFPPGSADQIKMDASRAQKVLRNPDHWASLDGASSGARADGWISKADAAAVAKNGHSNPEVEAAAKWLAQGDNLKSIQTHSSNQGQTSWLSRDAMMKRGDQTKGEQLPSFVEGRPAWGDHLGYDWSYNTAGESVHSQHVHTPGEDTVTQTFMGGDKRVTTQKMTEAETSRKVDTARAGQYGSWNQESKTTKTMALDKDVDGVNWLHGVWGTTSPQWLANGLEGKGTVYGERTTEKVGRDQARVTDTYYTTDASGERNRELSRITTRNSKGEESAPRWLYRSKNADGSWNSQLFVQGSKDTVVEKNTKQDGWNVKTQEADFREARQRALDEGKKGGELPPARSSRTEKTKENANAQDLDRALKEAGLSDLKNTAAYQEFLDKAGQDGFAISMSTTSTDGQRSGTVVAQAKDGSRVVLSDAADGSLAAQTSFGDDKNRTVVALGQRGQKLQQMEMQLDPASDKVQAFTLENGKKTPADPYVNEALTSARGIMAVGGLSNVNDYKGVATLGRMAASLGEKGTAAFRARWAQQKGGFTPARNPGVDKLAAGVQRGLSTTKQQLSQLERTLEKGFPRVSGAVGALQGVMAVNDAAAMADALAKGDFETAGRRASLLAMDTGGAIDGISKLMASRAGGTTASLSRAMTVGRVLGAAGAAASIGFGVYDVAQGRYLDGALGIATGVGTGMAIAAATWELAGWVGPAGWAIAGAATVGGAVYDTYKHVDATKIADLQIAR